MKKSHLAIFLLVFLIFLIPIEHKYDKLLRFFSKTLIPEGLEISKNYNKKIYFYISDFIALALLYLALFLKKISFNRFFGNPLWIVFFCAIASILVSPFLHYPVAYTRLIQLFTPLVLFSFVANSELRITRTLFFGFAFAGLCQTAIAIVQYFHQAPLGLRILGEPRQLCTISVPEGKRWFFDRFLETMDSFSVFRASATMDHPNILGGFLLISILITYALIVSAKNKWFWAFTLPFQFFALSITYSRSALFGLILASGIWFLQNRNRFLMGMVALSTFISAFLLHEQFIYRGGIVNYNECVKNSDSVRILHQKTALDIIREHPFFGLGYTQFSERSGPYLPPNSGLYVRATGPHNIYLMLASETGLISLAAFLFFIATLLWSFFKAPKTIEIAALSAIFGAFLFIGCCDLYFWIFQPGKLMFFLIAGLLAVHVHYLKKTESMTDPSRQDVWKMFDLISPTYDRVNRILSMGMDKRWRTRVSQHLPFRKHLKILDLATGTGDQIIALLQSKAPIQSIIGIDLSSEMLAIAKEKLKDKAQLIRADAEKLPFPDNHFDAATFSFGIRNVTNPLAALTSIHRVLKPSGRCLILEFSLPPQPIRFFYLFYLRYILPKIGGLLSKKPTAYRYLNQTIEHFPSGKEFGHLMRDAKFTHLSAIPMAFGAVTLYIGEKA